MYAVSRCVVLNGYFICCVSVCQLVLVCPGYDLKLPTPGVGANGLCCWSAVKQPFTHLLTRNKSNLPELWRWHLVHWLCSERLTILPQYICLVVRLRSLIIRIAPTIDASFGHNTQRGRQEGVRIETLPIWHILLKSWRCPSYYDSEGMLERHGTDLTWNAVFISIASSHKHRCICVVLLLFIWSVPTASC